MQLKVNIKKLQTFAKSPLTKKKDDFTVNDENQHQLRISGSQAKSSSALTEE